MNGDPGRPPYAAALATGAALLVLYVATLAPTTAFWDTSEYIATGYILGIPHPPGNPLFVALARSWIVLLAPTGLSVAVRVNLLAAVTSAAAGGFFLLVAWRVIVGFVAHRRVAVLGAVASAVLGGTAFTVWNQSNVNEKVYTLSVLVIAATSWLVLRWRDARSAGEPGSERWLLAAGYAMVLGSTNHLMSLLPLPAVAAFVLAAHPRVLLRGSLWVRGVPLVLLGLSFNFFLPVRAALDPVINEAEPVCESAPGAAAAIYTMGRSGCPALAASLRREQYQKPPITDRQAPFGPQMVNWFQYFDWQWARGASADERPADVAALFGGSGSFGDRGATRLPFTLLFLGLGLAGLWAAARGDPPAALYLGVLTATLSVGLVYYLNFRYGYSLYPGITDRQLHEVRERDYFFIGGFALWGALAGIGLTWSWAVATSVVRGGGRWGWTAPVMAVALVPLALNGPWASRAGDRVARDWAYDLLMSVEPYAVLFTNGDNDTFPLWYLQEVEGIRPDVTVVVGQYLHTTWYPRQLQRLSAPERQRSFAYPTGVDPYFDGSAALPAGPVIDLEPDVMDRVTGGRLDQDMTATFPGLAVTFPEGMYLSRSQRITLRIILDSVAERPVYFASSAGMMSELGLARWAVRNGLVSELVLRPPDGPLPPGTVQGQDVYGGEVFDLERSMHLWDEVYRYRGLLDRDVWADRSTLGIPWQYYALAVQLADVASRTGAPEEDVTELMGAAEGFLRTARGGSEGTPDRLLEGS
ncbi:MAG: DUF2723 domain-containing protein [Gemmatimonadota bacterium]|jgi:hypothetical protein